MPAAAFDSGLATINDKLWCMPRGEDWNRDETLLALRLYFPTPYGRIHGRNQDIIALAELLDRSVGSIARKMQNLASFDPVITESGRKGLTKASKLDAELFHQYHRHTDQLLWASDEALKRILSTASRCGEQDAEVKELLNKWQPFKGPTEISREVPIRRAQRFFRDTVLASYNFKCAVSGVDKRELLTASHIIPWSKDPERRSDPHNGLSLTALHDRAFDRGLISFDEGHNLLVAPKLKEGKANEVIKVALLELEGKRMETVGKFAPDPVALAYHRDRIFKAS